MKQMKVRTLKLLLDSFPPGWDIVSEAKGDLVILNPEGLAAARLVTGEEARVEGFSKPCPFVDGEVLPPPPDPEPEAKEEAPKEEEE